MEFGFTDEKYSLRTRVFKHLEEHIINGKIMPGESLIETKISEELGVSRTPVREAIRQLELEGLVKSFPNKGSVVLGVSTQDIEDIYSIRMLIEGLAAKWAAEKITSDEIDKLKDSVELSEFYNGKNNMDPLEGLDSKFHEIIYEACKSKPLKHMLATFHHYIQNARAVSLSAPGRARNAILEHRAILQAIQDHDSSGAEQLMYEHINNARINLIKQASFKEEI
jgi:DNA-binding GntR family transcriptional regulator